MQLGKKVFLITNGCPENGIDLATMQEFLKENGWAVTHTVEAADLVLFNTCGLTQYAQELSIKLVNQLKTRKKPSAEMVVFGCLPKINVNRLREVYQGFTFGSDEIERLTEVIETKTDPLAVHANYLIPYAEDASGRKWRFPKFKKLGSFMNIKEWLLLGYYYKLSQAINVFHPYTFCIKVSTGCLAACAFCAVKFSRGKVRSKPIHKVVEEFEKGLAKGYSEFALIGTDLGSYGREQGTTLVTLLKELIAREGDYQLRLRNIQPRFLIKMLPELQEFLQSGKIAYISSAAESGNNRILNLMKRGYTIEDFKEAILTINQNFPDIQLRSQLMVGFPSETEEEFQDTLRLLEEVRLDLVEVYIFEPRPNTKAAAMADQISQQVAKKRYHKLFMKALFNEKERKKKALRDYKENLRRYRAMHNF